MYWTLKKKDYDKITEIEGKTRSIAGLATAALNHLNNSTFKNCLFGATNTKKGQQ